MLPIDYTHPHKVPALYLQHDRRSANYYLRLDELPAGHRLHDPEWVLFRHPEWLEGGSAWVQALDIFDDLMRYALATDLMDLTVRPVVGSGDPSYDEALAQGLRLLGLDPLVAEVIPRDLLHSN